MFTRIGAAAFKKDLTNTLALCEAMGNPQHAFKSIHIAGTNGKGSTSHALASILQHAGYKVGLYTSPHLKDFRERIRINGIMIPEQEVVDFVATHKSVFDRVEPSFFEWGVALSFHYFAKEHVDVAIIETGLGGRLDSTNVISPQLSVITNIGWDHMDMLGDTLPKIANEKAGIIKPGIPVVVGEYHPETWPVFENVAQLANAKITLASQQINLELIEKNNHLAQYRWLNSVHPTGVLLECDLLGNYQLHNLKTVLCAIQQLQHIGYVITNEALRNGLRTIHSTTGLQGRWHVLGTKPLMVADTGHNVNGLEYVLQQIAEQSFETLHVVLGMVRDKDITKVLRLLPTSAVYYFTNAAIPRALPATELAELASTVGLKGLVYHSVAEAKKAAIDQAKETDMIFIGGSTFIVAEAV